MAFLFGSYGTIATPLYGGDFRAVSYAIFATDVVKWKWEDRVPHADMLLPDTRLSQLVRSSLPRGSSAKPSRAKSKHLDATERQVPYKEGAI